MDTMNRPEQQRIAYERGAQTSADAIRSLRAQLETARRELRNTSFVLEKLSEDLTATYSIDLLTGRFTILKLGKNTNASMLGVEGESHEDFDAHARRYAEAFLAEEDRPEFIAWFSCDRMRRALATTDRITYHYQSIPNNLGQRFFESQVAKVSVDDGEFRVFMWHRYIGNIMEKETAIQEELRQALENERLSNEIISAISKNYCSIYRIDLARDHFDEVSNEEETHRLTGVCGCASEQLLNLCEVTVAEEYRPYVREFLNLETLPARLASEDTVATEYRMTNGEWHKLRFIVKKRDAQERVTHVLCVVRSTSDTKRRELNLRFAAEAAAREAAVKTQFLANMSHDIRTPINGIVGMVELAEKRADDLEFQQESRNKIKELARYLVSLTNDVLDMSKIESGDLESRKMPFDVVETLRQVNDDAQRKAAFKGVNFEVKWELGNLRHRHLIGNPVFLARVLGNIADNAVKFTPVGGTVSVWCEERPREDGATTLGFYCKDTGVGMDKEFVEQAYNLFTQEKETSRSTYTGTGLGLAIAKRLVDKMGGTIELESELDAGTTAIVSVPLEIAAGQKFTRPEGTGGISLAGLRALVAEDNEINREIAAAVLEDSGLEVTCVADGVEAVERFEKSAPGYFSVIYMDIMMPRLNGLEATRRIRSLHRRDAASVPIIAMSANAFSDDIANSHLAGVSVHLAKPIDAAKLIGATKRCLSEGKPAEML